MLTLGPLAFASPWILLGLAALPAIWWLLRVSPPLPKRVRFPAIRLLVGLV
ncbi:MAG: BatA domain-containing protein, partial [Parvibaculum sp.]|nr:BatA domain-containing protein [Parvibaculum sp.]